MIYNLRSSFYKKSRHYVFDIEEDPETGFGRRDDRVGFGSLLQTDFACLQHVQEQETYILNNISEHWRQDRLRTEEE